MLLSDLNIKFNEIMNTLVSSLQKEDTDAFFNSPECIKEHLNLKEEDIQELNHESANYCEQKEWQKAAEALSWLVFFEPINSSHFLRLGTVLMQTQQYKEAIAILKMGSLLDLKNPKFPLYIGGCHLELGEKDLAKQAFTESSELSKNNKEYKDVFLLSVEANLS
ncbi:MAG: hypothetical protein JSS09_07565 [Verrucomicrobia bacterium]|nr:hypothetical protein [Verrucomicrobiota bacterium]